MPKMMIKNSNHRCFLSGLATVILGFITAAGLLAQSPNEAERHFQEGRYTEALDIYRSLASEHPDDA